MGCTVILACRSRPKAEEAMALLRKSCRSKNPGPLHFMEIDLADLRTIDPFVQQFRQSFQKIDFLFLNAGVSTPFYELSKQGFVIHVCIEFLPPLVAASPFLKRCDFALLLMLCSLLSLIWVILLSH